MEGCCECGDEPSVSIKGLRMAAHLVVFLVVLHSIELVC